MNKISGIYKIINKTNGKYYVGSSNNILSARFICHKYHLNKGIHNNNYLQRAWNKYGKNNFEFVVVEEIAEENLLLMEQKYLDIAKIEKDKCYNGSFIAGRVEMTPEIKMRISKSLLGRPSPTKGTKQSVERVNYLKSLIGEKNPSWKPVSANEKIILIDEYKKFGHTKMLKLAKEMGFGSFIVKKLVDECKKSMNFSFGKINRERYKKILTHEVKSDLISMRFQFGWTDALKLAKEKYGIGYKTLRRTVNEFYQTHSPQPT